MKKLFFTLVVVLASFQCIHGQVLISLLLGDKLNSDKIEFGLEGGLNFSKIRNIPESSRSLNKLNLGFYFDIKIKEKLFVHTGVLVKNSMGASQLNPYQFGDAELDSVLSSGFIERNIKYFNVPILFRHRFVDYTNYELGVSLGLMGKATDSFIVDVNDKKDLIFKNNVTDDYKRIEVGLMAGLGYKLIKGTGANLGVRYYWGLTNIIKDDSLKPQYNTSIYLYAGIPIGAGKAREKAEAGE